MRSTQTKAVLRHADDLTPNRQRGRSGRRHNIPDMQHVMRADKLEVVN